MSTRRLTKRVLAELGRQPKPPPLEPPRPTISALIMADQEEDFSSLPLAERFVHKVNGHDFFLFVQTM
jgi:hypothetical protein